MNTFTNQQQQPAAITALDVQQLLMCTYNHPDPQARVQAERTLADLSLNHGFTGVCMQVIMHADADSSVRQSASIYLKNLIKKHWQLASDKSGAFSDADKSSLKRDLFPALMLAPAPIRVQLTGILSAVVEDYPDKWPSYLTDVVGCLSLKNHNQVLAGLIGIHELVKTYRWKTIAKSKVSPMNFVVKAAFPHMLTLAESMLQSIDASNLQTALLLKFIVKTFSTSIQSELAKTLQEPSVLARWCTVFVTIVSMDLPGSLIPQDPEDIPKHIWFKAKKWSYNSLNKLFSRYGNSSLETFRDGSYRAFAKSFMSQFVPVIMRTYMAETEKIVVHGAYTPDKILYHIVSFYSDCIKSNVTWAMLKPHTDMLVSKMIFPALWFNDSDQELWEEDIVEYLQKKVDVFAEFQTSHQAMVNLLITLVTDRSKCTFIPVLQFINSVFSGCAACQPLNGPIEQARAKDSAMAMLIVISGCVMEKEGVKQQIGDVLVNYVFPELDSGVPFIRMRASQTIGAFCREDHGKDIVFGTAESGQQKYPGGWNLIAVKMLDMLRDTNELPIRVYAALALEQLVERDELRETLTPHIAFIMQTLLNLTNEVDMDVLADVMERFVEMYPNELAPIAVELCAQLGNSFIRLLSSAQTAGPSEDNDAWDENGDKTMAAMGIVKTMDTLLYSVCTEVGEKVSAATVVQNVHTVEKLEEIIVGCATYVLKNELLDLYDEIFEIADSCVEQLKRITPTMWTLFESLCHLLMTSAVDFIQEAFPLLDNFLSYGKDVVHSTPAVRKMLFDLIQKVMTHDSLDTTDRISGFKIIESMLHNCAGIVDEYVEPFIKIALDRLDQKESTAYFVHCLEVVLNCIHYNAPMALRYLQALNSIDAFFTVWTSNLSKMSRVHDKKLSIMASGAILSAVSGGFLEGVQITELHLIACVKSSVVMFESLPKAVEERQEMLDMYADDSDESETDEADMSGETLKTEESSDVDGEDDEDEELEEYDDDDDIPDDEAAYLEMLDKQQHQDDESEDDEYEDWSQELSEDLYYETPLEKLDVYVEFARLLEHIQHQNSQVFSACTGSLSVSDQKVLSLVYQTAQTNSELKIDPI